MSNQTKCPHCGKILSNPDKLAWHLMRECTEFVTIAGQSKPKDTNQPAQSSGD